MNGFKKICSFTLLIILLLAFFNPYPVRVQAREVKDNRIDAVIVLDASTSMRKSDPKNIRLDAFKLFVDMCHVNGDSIGLVAFGDNLAREVKPVSIVDQRTKEELKKKADGIPLSENTDIGLGLKKAVEYLQVDSKNSPLIVLLSDGKNDPKRAVEESEKDIRDAIEFAKQNGKPIYTIGLNANGQVDENLLKKIAIDTNGKSFIIDNAGELPRIFGEIFAEGSKLKMIKGDTVNFNGSYQEIKIDMPDENIVEGNLAIMSDGILDIKVFDAKGTEQPINSDRIKFIKSDNYSMIKFINPENRNWIIKIKGYKGKQGIFNYIYNYNLEMEAKLSQTAGLRVGDTIKVNAVLMSNGKGIADSEFYSGLTGKLLVKDIIKGEEKEFPLNYTGKGFEGEYKIGEKGEIELRVRIDGESLYRESDPFKIEFEKAAPASANPGKVDDKGTLDKLKDYLSYIAGGIGILFLLIVLAVLRRKRKPVNGRVSREAKVKDVEGDIKERRVEVTLYEEETREKPFNNRGLVGEDASINNEASISKPPSIKKEESLNRESRIAGGEFSGQIMLAIKEWDSEEASHPLFKNLMDHNNSVTLSQLLSNLPEFRETQKIIFYPGLDETLIIKNQSSAEVLKNGIDIGDNEVQINNEEKLVIILKRNQKTIYLQYFARRK